MKFMNNIDKDFRAHLFVELFYREHKGFILEQAVNESRNLLFEEYGVFNGCEKIAREIVKIVQDNFNFERSYYTIKMKNCDFIDSLQIMITNEYGAGFDTNGSKLDANFVYNPLCLQIGKKIIWNNDDALPCVMHELLHTYQNINLAKKGYSLRDKLNKVGYFNINRNNSTNSLLDNILYYLNRYEVGGYITSLVGDLKSSDRNFVSVDEVYEFLKTTVDYKNYQQIFKMCKMFNDLTDKNIQKDILDFMKNKTDKVFNTYNQFLKWLNYSAYKVQRKFNTIAPKLAYDYLQMGGLLKHSNRELISEDLPWVVL